ncbi:hypothetical protein GGI07_005704 [Coemansia sp. Benny D115]|nr:hypothetical protein GGI07_005704 [Coemansia sp. Benny D115]
MVHARDGTPVYLRIIHFSCDAIAFNVAMALSNQAETPLPNNFEVAHTESVRRLQGQGADVGVGEGPGMHLRDAIYATRDGGFHACLVLEKQDVVDSASPMGPRVVFASKSFERIVGKDTSDVHGLAFLTLVAPQDVGRAARFLQDVACSPNFLIGHLNFQTDAQSSRQLQVSGYVSVEIVGAGSDDGAILLCRMDGAAAAAEPAYGRRVRMGGDIDDGYMSLEDILTSDPETSNLSDVWYQCQ